MSGPPRPAFTTVCHVLAAIGAAGILAVLTGQVDRLGREPDRHEARGPFDIVTHTNLGYESYSVRYHGEPFVFEGRAGMFGDETATYSAVNAVVTWDESGEVFVVHIGDPNNTGFYYLVREQDGAARARFLGESHGGVAADWLEPPTGDRLPLRDVAMHRGRLAGGRWLLLGDDTVLDTRTLNVHGLERPRDIYLNAFRGSLAFAPDQRSFVRLGSGADDTPVLVVTSLGGGVPYQLPIDVAAMDYPGWEELPPGWIDHHFLWRRADDGVDRLERRDRWTPWREVSP